MSIWSVPEEHWAISVSWKSQPSGHSGLAASGLHRGQKGRFRKPLTELVHSVARPAGPGLLDGLRSLSTEEMTLMSHATRLGTRGCQGTVGKANASPSARGVLWSQTPVPVLLLTTLPSE